MKDLLRCVKLEAQTGRVFVLSLYATERCDNRGQTVLAYELTGPEEYGPEPIFDGSDFVGSPMHSDDSDETLRALISFLTLRPGDTDSDYFADYTPRQKEFCAKDAETLSLYSESEYGYSFEDA